MDNLEEFLRNHRTNEKNKITHTRIGNIKKNIFGGSYCIEDKDLSIFYKLYHHDIFVKGKEDCITEKQISKNNPILIDFDFRYNSSVTERKHCEDHIIDLIDLYMEKINSIINLEYDRTIPVYVMEKDNINRVELKGKEITKDGIHIIIGLSMDHTLQCILRNKVLEEISSVLGDLPLENTYDNVLDDGISKGHTNWQLYGSNKPDNEAYKIKYIYNVDFSEDGSFTATKQELKKYNNLQLLKLLSARNNNYSSYNMKDDITEEYNRIKDKRVKKKTKKPSSLKANSMFNFIDISRLTCMDALDEELEKFIDSLTYENNNLKETHSYVMCLPEVYSDDFNKWIRCGWALHNCHHNMFLSWVKFSSKSVKFSFDDIEGLYETWNNMKDEGYTERSIMYWAKQENPIEFNKIRKETIDYYMENCGKNESDIAQLLYQIYKDEYRCASIKNKTWYRFLNHRWLEIDSGTTLRYNISRYLARMFGDKSFELKSLAVLQEENEELEENNEYIKKLAKKYTEISSMLKLTSVKQNIMKEAAEVFYDADPEFEKKLDSNTELICFTNGIYDFETKSFRDGQPDDYISCCTNIPYVSYDNSNVNHNKIKDQIDLFMSQLFPDETLRKYMWQHLSTCLTGTNKKQTINIYNGCGRNGKSALAELMEKTLGDYYGTLSAAIITSKRVGIGGLSPELVKVKPCRFVLMSEPSKNDTINDGYMKQLTGGDPIEARGLHKDPITYRPQFKMIVCTNNLFEIKSNDDGTWRRIRVCEFESKFVTDPNPTPDSPYEFLINENLNKEFDKWKSIFASLLVHVYNNINGIVEDCERVMRASNSYRNDQDYFMRFYTDKIEKGNQDSIIKKPELYREFKTWYTENFDKNIPKGTDLYNYMTKKLGDYNGCWTGYNIKYDYNNDILEDTDI